MVTKCAKLTKCTMLSPTVMAYEAKSCNGDEKFSYYGPWDTLGYANCPTDQLLQVDYDLERDPNDRYCPAKDITLANNIVLATDI